MFAICIFFYHSQTCSVHYIPSHFHKKRTVKNIQSFIFKGIPYKRLLNELSTKSELKVLNFNSFQNQHQKNDPQG